MRIERRPCFPESLSRRAIRARRAECASVVRRQQLRNCDVERGARACRQFRTSGSLRARTLPGGAAGFHQRSESVLPGRASHRFAGRPLWQWAVPHGLPGRRKVQMGAGGKPYPDDAQAAVAARGTDRQIEQARTEVNSLHQQLKIGSEISDNPSPQEQSYWDKKQYLDGLLETHKALYSKIKTEEIDAQIPKTSMVQVIDMARIVDSQ